MTGDWTPGTHYTIHHIKVKLEEPMWPTERLCEQRKKGKGGGGTLEKELCEWVGE